MSISAWRAIRSRGRYPRGLIGELAYWTIFGVDRDTGAKPLLSEDGAIETPAGFTLEPFVRIDGRLMTWADVSTTQSLEQNSLPLPSTTWRHPKFTLEIAPFGAGTADAPIGYARYRLRNTSAHPERAQFYVAVRPLRVTPPWFELNINELTAPIRSIAWTGSELAVDDTRVVPLTKPTSVAASTFDSGDASELFDSMPATHSVTDPQRHASALMLWDLTLAPGEEKIIDIATPLHAHDAQPIPRDVAHQRANAIAYWRKIVDHVDIDIPAARDLIDTARANVAYNLLGRDGPAIRGGARNYRRSWIRDGSLASTMLLRFGLGDDVRDYIRWFAPYQFADGKIPCCVDTRGADPVDEHDSHGEFIYLVAEHARLTGDLSLAREIWPHVEKAADYIDSLRHQTSGEFKGLLPPSISHEGYSAKPMHSYWDDFFALRGLKDAAWLAEQLGNREAASRFAKERDEFSRDFHASILRAIEAHHIDYIPGCRGPRRFRSDLDDDRHRTRRRSRQPSARCRDPRIRARVERVAGADGRPARRGRTTRRTSCARSARSSTSAGAIARSDCSHSSSTTAARRLETMGRGRGAGLPSPTYLGDIPHLWVGSDFARSFIDMLAYERESDDALVLGAGIPSSWLDHGVRVRGLRTIYGPLNFSARRDGKRIVVNISGVRVPRGGIVVAVAGGSRAGRAEVAGRTRIHEVTAFPLHAADPRVIY